MLLTHLDKLKDNKYMPTDTGEFLSPNASSSNEVKTQVVQPQEQQRGKLYGELLYKEASSLLARYLPEALPQEPTEILSGLTPFYMGKFKGKHYIQREPITITHDSEKQYLEDLKRYFDAFKERLEAHHEEEMAWIELVGNKFTSGEWTEQTDFDALEKEFFAHRQEEPALPDSPNLDIGTVEDPERLMKGYEHYSVDTWAEIHGLVHELAHQRQAELNPEALPQLSSPELDVLDPDKTPRDELKRLLTEASKGYGRTVNSDSLFLPVIEGEAVVGSYYVMGRLEEDLIKSGKGDIAAKLREARKKKIRSELVRTERERRKGTAIPYNLHYVEGSRMLRKLYKQLGNDTPVALTSVDLNACRGIIKGSQQYQQIIENPSLLPGLNKSPLVGSSIK